jgi:ABC-2 type transport system permease protein
VKSFFIKFSAFLLKDLKIAFTYKFNILIQILLILFFLTLIFFSLGDSLAPLNQNSIQDQNAEFFKILIGVALIDFMFSSMSVFSREIRFAQTYGTFEALILTNTSILTILLTSYALTFSRSIFRILIYILLGRFIFGLDISFEDIPIFLTLIVYSSLPFIGIGLFAASFIILFKVGNIINFFVGIGSIFFSGIFFSLDNLPLFLGDIYNKLPLTIGLNMAEQVLLGNTSFKEIYYDLLKVFYLIVVFVPSGIFLVYYSLGVAKKNGSLNHY